MSTAISPDLSASHKWLRFATTDHKPVRIFHRGWKPAKDFNPKAWFAYGTDSAITAVGRVFLSPALTAVSALKASKKAKVPQMAGVPQAILIGATWGLAKGLGGGAYSASAAAYFLLEGVFCTVAFPIVNAGKIVGVVDRRLGTERQDAPSDCSKSPT